MKKLKCDLCDVIAEGETFEMWMQNLMPHYMQAHADIMQNKAGLSAEEMQVEKEKWMIENKARFDAA